MDDQHHQGGVVAAVRAKPVVAVDQLVEALKEHPPDIVLCAEDVASLDLERTLARVRETDEQAPVISVADNGANIVAYMQKGAADRVSRATARISS
jgi:DNA-binding NtrC family response regulator